MNKNEIIFRKDKLIIGKARQQELLDHFADKVLFDIPPDQEPKEYTDREYVALFEYLESVYDLESIQHSKFSVSDLSKEQKLKLYSFIKLKAVSLLGEAQSVPIKDALANNLFSAVCDALFEKTIMDKNR